MTRSSLSDILEHVPIWNSNCIHLLLFQLATIILTCILDFNLFAAQQVHPRGPSTLKGSCRSWGTPLRKNRLKLEGKSFSLFILRGLKVLYLGSALTNSQTLDLNQFRAIEFWNFRNENLLICGLGSTLPEKKIVHSVESKRNCY